MRAVRKLTASAAASLPGGAAVHYDASQETLGALATLTDRSGNGRHASQATAGFRPVVTDSASPLNGKRGLLFDGSDDVMSLAGPSFNGSAHTLIAAFMPQAVGASAIPRNAVQETFTHSNASPLTGANYAQGFNAGRTGKWLANAYASSGTGISGFYNTATNATGAAEAYATLVNTTDGSNFVDAFLWVMLQNAAGPSDSPTGTWTTAGKGYALNLHCATNAIRVFKQKNGVTTNVLNVTPPSSVLTAGDKWLLRYTGSVLEVWLQRSGYNGGMWTMIGSVAESEFTGGLFGLETSLSTVSSLDDWGYGSLPTLGGLLMQGTANGAALNLATLKANWVNAGTSQLANSTLSLGAPNVYTYRASGGSLAFARQGSSDGGGATYSGFAPDTFGQNFSGYIFEIVAYNRALSAFEKRNAENYLKLKWSIGTIRPSGSGIGIRPFKTSSSWNRNVSADPIDPTSAAIVAAITANSITKSAQSGFNGNPDIFALPIYDVPPGQALVPVFVTGAYTNCTSETVMQRTNSYFQSIMAPMPLSWQSDEAGDNNTELIDWNTGDEWGFHGFYNPEGRVVTNGAMAIGAISLPVSSADAAYFSPSQNNVVLSRGTINEETVTLSSSWNGTAVPIPLQTACTKAHLSGSPVGGAACGNAFHYNIFWSGIPPDVGPVNGPSQGFANSGAGAPYMTGVFRPWEIKRGAIDHALSVALTDGLATYVSPATRTDQNPPLTVGAGGWPTSQPSGTSLLVAATTGNSSAPVVGEQMIIGLGTANEEVLTVASIPDATHLTFTTATLHAHAAGETIHGYGSVAMGRRFRLKASYDTSGLTGTAKVVAEAVKKYGMIFRDGSGHMKLTPEGTLSASWGVNGNPNLSNAVLSVIPLSELELLA